MATLAIKAMSMTEEEKLAAEAESRANETEAEKLAREQEEKIANLKKNYEEDLKKEREAREKAEKAAAELSFKKRKEKDEEEDEERPLTKSELQSILENERKVTRVEMQRDSIEGKIKSLASSDTEADLMIEISKNRTFPSHYSVGDIAEEIYAIVNRKKIVLERDEALRALASKENANRSGTGGHHDSIKAEEPQINEYDKNEYIRIGFMWNGTSRRYEKKLRNGDVLIKDPTTKKVSLLRKSS